MKNRTLRERLRAIPFMLERLKKLADVALKNSKYSLLLSYGYLETSWFDPVEYSGWMESDRGDKRLDEPLTFAEWTKWNTWFTAYPDKVCGVEAITSSQQFPISLTAPKTTLFERFGRV